MDVRELPFRIRRAALPSPAARALSRACSDLQSAAYELSVYESTPPPGGDAANVLRSQQAALENLLDAVLQVGEMLRPDAKSDVEPDCEGP
jgi:hypothetical protein